MRRYSTVQKHNETPNTKTKSNKRTVKSYRVQYSIKQNTIKKQAAIHKKIIKKQQKHIKNSIALCKI